MKIFKKVNSVLYCLAILLPMFLLAGCPVKNEQDLKKAFETGGTYVVGEDFTFYGQLTVKKGKNVVLKCTKEYGQHTILYGGKGGTLQYGAIEIPETSSLSLGFGDKGEALETLFIGVASSTTPSLPPFLILNKGLLAMNNVAIGPGDIRNEGKGTLEMDNGVVVGSGVLNYGTFIMKDGLFWGAPGNAVDNMDGGKFTMEKGVIWGTDTGVTNDFDSTFTMNGGEIYKNTTGVLNMGKFTIQGTAKIHNNTTGVWNISGSGQTPWIFNWYGGTIYDNNVNVKRN